VLWISSIIPLPIPAIPMRARFWLAWAEAITIFGNFGNLPTPPLCPSARIPKELLHSTPEISRLIDSEFRQTSPKSRQICCLLCCDLRAVGLLVLGFPSSQKLAARRFFTLPFLRPYYNREKGHCPAKLVWHSRPRLWVVVSRSSDVQSTIPKR
jgi:hypothetical protein